MIKLAIFTLALFLAGFTLQAQTVTLAVSNNLTGSYKLATNQVVTINSFLCDYDPDGEKAKAFVSFQNGVTLRLDATPTVWTGKVSGYASLFTGYPVVTGATNIFVTLTNTGFPKFNAALTFTITTPSVQSSIPANAVVIPTDATGPVQIVLESSSDLINWTSALPGTYGNTHSNRFFRVRAIAQ